MIYAMSLLTMIAAAVLSVRSCKPRETHLVLTRVIPRPIESVFDIINSVEKIPIWRRYPGWLPAFLRVSRMSGWGGHSSSLRRDRGTTICGPEEIAIRRSGNREFGYQSIRPGDFAYESLFHLAPQDDKCLLNWEIRFKVHRPADIFRLSRIVADARADMMYSFDYIQRIAVSRDSVVKPGGIFAARRKHAPAA